MEPGKTGRNAPCPCGSGKKYKKCCLLKSKTGNPRIRIPPPAAMPAALRQKIEAERLRRDRFGEIRPSISTDFNGNKFVAVGSELHSSKQWKTFPDFLLDYIKNALTPAWGKTELSKPLTERHEIMKWYDAMCRFQKKQVKGDNGLYRTIPNGAMRAYILLSYDLYTLRHHSALQMGVVARLKHKDQFQGARHELFAAATCIRSGYDIAFEDESNLSKRHTEFVATHIATRQKVAVEAKSRHRPGVLGRPGTPQASGEIRAGIKRLLRDAFDKPTEHPYVVFVDLNLPHSSEPIAKKPWFQEIVKTVDRVAKERGNQDVFNLIVFTNQPDHYGEHDAPAPAGTVLSVLSQKPRIPAVHPEAIVAIHEAANKYGAIPNTFAEAG